MRIAEPWFRRVIKPLVFTLLLMPLILLLIGIWQNSLGVNPIETLTRSLGEWALRILLLTLMISPLRRLSHWGQLLTLRRMLGLYSFFYAFLHLFAYLWLDQFFDWSEIWFDIVERPFITVGMLTFLLLLPLALTSTKAMMRRLKKNWLRLHRLIYPLSLLAVLHFWWLVKADTLEPLIYSMLLAVLLGERIWRKRTTITQYFKI